MTKTVILIIISILIYSTSIAQTIIRDPNPRKDVAHVFFNSKYTLFDHLTDEPIFPDQRGIYSIYYASNENRRPYSYKGNAKGLSKLLMYKFKNYSNCNNWCKVKSK